jgi:hypothetical protein
MITTLAMLTILIIAFRPPVARAQNSATRPKAMADGATAPIPTGTTITMQNWQQYRHHGLAIAVIGGS